MRRLVRFHCGKKSLAIFLGITKSHSQMYLKWTSQNLISLANPLSLSLWKALSFYPNINMTRLLSSYKLFALTLLEKWYRTGGNRTRFDPHLTWNTCICYSHSLLPLLQDWQLQVSGGRGFGVLVKRLFYKHDPSLLARFVKNAVPHPVSHGPYFKMSSVENFTQNVKRYGLHKQIPHWSVHGKNL